MKKIILLFLSIFLICSCLIFSCHKAKSFVDKGCGCNTDSVWHYAYYDNFGGFNDYEAHLYYNPDYNAWFIGVNIPNTDYGALLEICNQELPAIRSLTDTSSRRYPISIKFAGKLTQLCPDQPADFGYMFVSETLCANVIIDSLKKR